jgi:AcrR family transcriptional regulator
MSTEIRSDRPRNGRPSRGRKPGSGHDRVLSAAYGLFLRRGVRAVGVDEIIAEAGVAKATFYRHFRSKDALIRAFMAKRYELWTLGWLQAEVMRREASARSRLIAIFDLLDEWFHGRDYAGCPFIGTVAQAVDPSDPVRREAVAQLAAVRAFLRGLALEAGAEDPDSLAQSWHLLMEGSIVMAMTGDLGGAKSARAVGELLLRPKGAGA